MSGLIDFFNISQANCKEEYYLHDTLQLDEETKSESDLNNNKYFELSDYDMMVTNHVEILFNEEKDNLHLNKFYDENNSITTKNHNFNTTRENFLEKTHLKNLQFIFMNFIPLNMIVFTRKNLINLVFKSEEIPDESKELKEVWINFVTFFLFLLNFFIYFQSFDKSWKLFFLLINNIYLLYLIVMILLKKKKEISII